MAEEIHKAMVNIEKNKARDRGYFRGTEERLPDSETHHRTILRYERPRPLVVPVLTHRNMKLELEESMNPITIIRGMRNHQLNVNAKIQEMAWKGYPLSHVHLHTGDKEYHVAHLFFVNRITGRTFKEIVRSERYPTLHESETLDERESLTWAAAKGLGKAAHWGIVGGIGGFAPEAVPFLAMAHGHFPYGYYGTGRYYTPIPTSQRVAMGAVGAVGGTVLGGGWGAIKNVLAARRRNAQEKFAKGDRVTVDGRAGIVVRHNKKEGTTKVKYDDNVKGQYNPSVYSTKLKHLE